MYKLVNGYPEPAPREFVENGKRIVGFTDDFLRERGYKPVVWSEPTSETQVDSYTEDSQNIYQRWEEPHAVT